MLNSADEDMLSSSQSADAETPSILSSDADSISSQSADGSERVQGTRHRSSMSKCSPHTRNNKGDGRHGCRPDPTLRQWDESYSEDNDYDRLTSSGDSCTFKDDLVLQEGETEEEEKGQKRPFQYSNVLNWLSLSGSSSVNSGLGGSGDGPNYNLAAMGEGYSSSSRLTDSNSTLQMPNSVNTTEVNKQINCPPRRVSSAATAVPNTSKSNMSKRNSSSTAAAAAVAPDTVFSISDVSPIVALDQKNSLSWATTTICPPAPAELPKELCTDPAVDVCVNFIAFGNDEDTMLRLARIIANKVAWESYGVMSIHFFFGRTITKGGSITIEWNGYSRNSFGDLVKSRTKYPQHTNTNKNEIYSTLAVIGYFSGEPVSFDVPTVYDYLSSNSIPTIAISAKDDVLAPPSLCEANKRAFMSSPNSIYTEIFQQDESTMKQKRFSQSNVIETVPVPIGVFARKSRANHILQMMQLYPQPSKSRPNRGPEMNLQVRSAHKSSSLFANKSTWLTLLLVLLSLIKMVVVPNIITSPDNSLVVPTGSELVEQQKQGIQALSPSESVVELKLMESTVGTVCSYTATTDIAGAASTDSLNNLTIGNSLPPMPLNESSPLFSLNHNAVMNVLSQTYSAVDLVVTSVTQWFSHIFGVIYEDLNFVFANQKVDQTIKSIASRSADECVALYEKIRLGVRSNLNSENAIKTLNAVTERGSEIAGKISDPQCLEKMRPFVDGYRKVSEKSRHAMSATIAQSQHHVGLLAQQVHMVWPRAQQLAPNVWDKSIKGISEMYAKLAPQAAHYSHSIIDSSKRGVSQVGSFVSDGVLKMGNSIYQLSRQPLKTIEHKMETLQKQRHHSMKAKPKVSSSKAKCNKCKHHSAPPPPSKFDRLKKFFNSRVRGN